MLVQPLASPKCVVWLSPYFPYGKLVKGPVLFYERSSADRQVLGFSYISIHATRGPKEGRAASMEPDGVMWDHVHSSKAAASART